MLKTGPWRWVALAVIVLGALLLRTHDLSRIFLWLDETDMFNEYVYGDHPKSLVDFALTTRNTTTVTWGWPAVIWIVTKLFGPTVGVARMPTVIASTLGVLLIFVLVYHLLPRDYNGNRVFPALFAAGLAAISMPQLEYAQRTYPYGVTPCLAAAILLAHFEVLRAASDGWKYSPRMIRAVALYTAVVSIALCIHASLAFLPAISALILAFGAIQDVRRQPWEQKGKLLALAAGAGSVLFVVALLNAKNPKFGFRPYLTQYYEPVAFKSIPKLLGHAYDLATYHLNLFYNPALYWPERLNIVLLPLVAICILGWSAAALGKFGLGPRRLALLGLAMLATTAVLSLVKVFPFGGVRQSLFFNPFFLIFTALGFYSFRFYPATRIVGTVAATAYLALWAVNLPRFYQERQTAYTADDLVSAWTQTGKLPVYARECEREIRYELRAHPEIQVNTLPKISTPPYLLITTHHWIGDNTWFSGFPEYLESAGYKATIVKQAPGLHLDSRSQSLYFPANGLWIYKITQ